MEEIGPDKYAIETGEALLVGVATHGLGGVSVVGTFTEMRLALIGTKAFTEEYDGVKGPVVSTFVCETALNQHGTCPELHLSEPDAEEDPFVVNPATKEQVLACKMLVETDYHQGHFSFMPDYAVVSGLILNDMNKGERPGLVWDIFHIEGSTFGDLDKASAVIGLPILAEEPEIDNESESNSSRGYDDMNAAMEYLRLGGTLCKVPDEDGSPHFRMLIVHVEGSPERGNIVV